MSFGIMRHGHMYRGTEDTSLGNILKQLFLKPYFMLYGEVYAPEIDRMLVSFPDLFLSHFINLAIDFPEEMKDAPLAWVLPSATALYMWGSVIIILSLII